MARLADRLPANADGDFFVDRSCIDCDLCRQLAPAVFARSDRDAQSYVAAQPRDAGEQHRALMALVTCPTSSIGTTRKLDSRAAARALPEAIAASPGFAGARNNAERCAAVDDVYFVGWAAESSYGAASWLIRRPGGNVLVDSPRAASTLLSRLGELGGVAIMFLTHRDDVADHAEIRAKFRCERLLHRADVSASTRDVERVVDGTAPIALAPDLTIVPVPGHTRGSCVLIYKDAFAFTGDHVWATDDGSGLEAGRGVCWYSWPEQKQSMLRLAEHRFDQVLPGHGRRFRAPSAEAMRAELRRLASTM